MMNHVVDRVKSFSICDYKFVISILIQIQSYYVGYFSN